MTTMTNGRQPVVEGPARQRYSLSVEEVEALRDQGNVVPIYREIMADMETPVSAYLKIASGPYSFLLESVEGGERLARYSFIGTDPYLTVRLDGGTAYANQRGYKQEISYEDPLVALQTFLAPYKAVDIAGLPRFLGGAVGYLSYEAVRYFENLPIAPNDPNHDPDGVYMFVDTMVVFDHLERRVKVVSHVHIDPGTPITVAYEEAAEKIEELAGRLEAGRVDAPVTDRPFPNQSVRRRALI